jgi:hypothetical protein
MHSTKGNVDMRAHGAYAEPLEAHHATETKTKKPNLQDANNEHAQVQLARPANWASMSQKAKKNWKQMHEYQLKSRLAPLS